ncbi:hypothetical protein LSH36_852g00037 [Paralvinella palmiformis]|uniref:TIR domain-containing protein n=1 Tax=Paralvinella palmiformis TaxID=53620 RepID=A0AAD9IZA7_9ANNE|nr:hypothetical protein LSH36_852g00037 [Paralvinella palmiformis]
MCFCNGSAEVEIVCRYKYFGCKHAGQEPLKRIPANLPERLVLLNFDSNDIATITSSDFKGCGQLRSLLLSNNMIAAIAGDAFSDLTNLQYLHLHYNRLYLNDTESFPVGVLDPVTSLVSLKLQCNTVGNLSTYRKDIFQNKTSLRSIALDSVDGARLPKPDDTIELNKLDAVSLYNIVPELGGQFDYWDNLTIRKLGAHTSGCNNKPLTKIDTKIFRHLPDLEQLDISNNPNLSLNHTVLNVLKALNGSKVRKLYLMNIGNGTHDIGKLPDEIFVSLKFINLTELYLDGNGIGDLQARDDLSSYLPHLEVLSLSYNRLFDNVINVLNRTANLTKLRMINMNRQTRPFPESDDLNKLLNLRASEIPDTSTSVDIPSNLNELHLADAIGYSYFTLSNITITGGSQNMSLIDLSCNSFPYIKGPLILRNSPYLSRQIERLNFSDCRIKYICKTLFPPDANLTIVSLDLSGNTRLGHLFESDVKGEILGNLNHTGIQILNISATYTSYLHSSFFKYLTTLRELVLNNNELVHWPECINHLNGLTDLDLSVNKLLFLPDYATSFISRCGAENGVIRLDISDNPLLDECDRLSFLQWLNHCPETVVLKNKAGVIFFTGVEKNISELHNIIQFLQINCKSEIWAKVTAWMSACMVVVVYLAVLVHRNRWSIKYFFVELSRRRKGYESQTNDEDFEYDAFVAYHKDSLTWLVQEMVEHLEGRLTVEPLRLCLHHRDWLPGIPIEENVLSSIKKSRRTVILLTRSFLRSNWCDFEFQMARIHGFDEGHEVLVVVQLEEIPVNELNRTLLKVRKTHTWLEWPTPDDAEAVDAFWERLKRTLNRRNRKPAKCTCGRIVNSSTDSRDKTD